MIRVVTILTGISIASVCLTGCRSHAPASVAGSSQMSLPPGEEEVIVYCAGPGYETTSETFRAHAMGESIDMNIAKRKALANARLELASSIETTVRSVSENYLNSVENGNTEQTDERYEQFTREVVNQNLRGIRLICERYTLTAEDKYRAYVGIELSAEQLVEDYYRRIGRVRGETGTGGDADFVRFREAFQSQMVNGE